MKLSDISILNLHKAIQKGDISASEIANKTIAMIKQYNPKLNAWTEITEQRILKEANIIDKKKNKGEFLTKLAGIPYAVKNLFDVSGYTTISGSNIFIGHPIAQNDAWIISKLSKLGALLSGMLNMDAYAYGFTTENSYYGTTHNPHDLTRIAGGSSGGSAAAVASGLVHFSLGTDTNGSVRVPASLCGIFGLKPTFGRLSRRGTHTFVHSLDHVGVFARRVEDLSLVYDYIQGRDIKDPFQADFSITQTLLQLGKKNKELRCAILGGFFSRWCGEDAQHAINIAGKALQANDEIMIPEAEIARSAAFIITAGESGNQYLPSLRKTPEKFECNSRERLLAGAIIPGTWYIQAQRFRRHFQKQVLPLFKQFDILIAPATPCTAITIGQKSIRINGHDLPAKSNMGMLTQPISFLGLPVCTVPLRTRNGLPIGIQLIAAPCKEETTLCAAYFLEKRGLTMPQISMFDK
ncbi:Asp-tRNA(Asn)/Glu-tRNA(Gln) amidotransferase GatCAB subunit A [Candidatus Pantoea edessiphila]|uniref:Asp-tRNA(Asn)/Glu-tRNA(Gln) amidotransferase GatCAB subunit A n=1 Tax=Candidatus Pantoea edessiphila TaxID=2044610 RepID=A0A2P5SXD6_9GAMM|nr:AtzE family amidohydrolase [Candidatus Pantoea edessiphila]MBK4775817.1 AtzE family amidohydrolase [Pantoea sp. Edef]PPI87001.1 Asp-tRNA(Asn)/Glu-tRNA(Gln) amidotransferase GatCAB subunit A [Candidatus Pantoea edessiphila]